MAKKPFANPIASEPDALEARRATAALFARVAAHRRRTRRWARFRSRERLVDLAFAMATYTGVTIAVVLGAIYGIETAVGLLVGSG